MKPNTPFSNALAGWKPALITLFCGLLLASCKPQTQQPPPPAPEVSTVTVVRQSVLLTTELPGRASAYGVAEIRPQVSGLIQERRFTEGSEVRSGDVLYLIDPAPFQAAFDSAQAARRRAEASLPAARLRADRFKKTLAIGAVSQQGFDDADAALKQAEADVQYQQAALEIARINLDYTRVVSPISGRIGKSAVTVGAIVTAYQPLALATIQQLDPIYVDVPQSTTELMRLRRRLENGRLRDDGSNQNKVRLTLADGMPYPIEGTLQFRDISVDPTTASVTLRMVFPNPDNVLLPGMFVRTQVKEGVDDQAILIPQQAVSRDPKGNPLALVVNAGGKVGQQRLTVARAIDNQWLVTEGLTPGDHVVVEGMQRTRAGGTVKEVPYETTPGQVANTIELN